MSRKLVAPEDECDFCGRALDGDGLCPSCDPDGYGNCREVSECGDYCIREEGHAGLHTDRLCDGTCDSCDCIEWTDGE